MNVDISEKFLEYAEMISELSSTELKAQNIRRIIEDTKSELFAIDDGSCGLDLSAHAFKQISERLEKLAIENTVIYEDVFNRQTKSECILLPSNLKSFVITLVANAHRKGEFSKEPSKNNSAGVEYRYSIEIKKWSSDKDLYLICIVENNNIKTGYFNWV